MGNDDETTVRVAVRIRPLSFSERIQLCQSCTHVSPNESQVILKDRPFTFDHVLDTSCSQSEVYDTCSRSLIEGVFEGYNATIFAYGQTGSGKTYTMGTGFDVQLEDEFIGIIPRAVDHLFYEIQKRRAAALENGLPLPEFKISTQFMELYNEQIIDLLDTTSDALEKDKKSHIKIHEDAAGQICTVGISVRSVSNKEETMECIKTGALNRATASTKMNSQSSRSHAIFTIHIRQTRFFHIKKNEDDINENAEKVNNLQLIDTVDDSESLTAKFHFVDLAGSEKLKRTGSTGKQAKEGIAINCGLLALGNVISALGDKLKRGCHVPYRDSKLTRLLQDSLGGNSRTLMIACISPSDGDFMETLNTLQYANRARNIKNKVIVNQDKSSRQLMELRELVSKMTAELNDYKLGKKSVGEGGVEYMNDLFGENTMLQEENDKLRLQIKVLKNSIETLQDNNCQLTFERDLALITSSGSSGDEKQVNNDFNETISGYIKEISSLKQRVFEAEEMCNILKSTSTRFSNKSDNVNTPSPRLDTESLLEVAKKDVDKLLKMKQEKEFRISTSNSTDDGNDKLEHEFIIDSDENIAENESGDDQSSDSENSEENLSTGDCTEMQEELAELTCDISIKLKLIEDLELNQKRLKAVRSQYENKLATLETRIKETEKERDRVLVENTSKEKSNMNSEKIKQIKEQYEKKLYDLQNKLQKLHSAEKEHAKLIRKSNQDEKQLELFRRDLSDMKKAKVRLMNEIKQNSVKTREKDIQHNRQLAQMKKDQRKKESKIRILEHEHRKKDIVLKRKLQEMEQLRKRSRESQPARQKKISTGKKIKIDDKALTNKWSNLEKSISDIISKIHTINLLEKDMQTWVKERGKLSKKLDQLQLKKKEYMDCKNIEKVHEIDDQIKLNHSSIAYIQDNLTDIQSQMVEMREYETETKNLIGSTCSDEESIYLLEHCINMALSQGVLAAQKDVENKRLLANLRQERNEAKIRTDMLHFLMEQEGLTDRDKDLARFVDSRPVDDYDDDYNIITDESSNEESDSVIAKFMSPGPASTYENVNVGNIIQQHKIISPIGSSNDSVEKRVTKARKKTATPNDLLFATSNDKPPSPIMHKNMSISADESMLRHSVNSSPTRKNCEEKSATSNVFQRLSSMPEMPKTKEGIIERFSSTSRLNTASIRQISTARGHSRDVLSICVTNDLLISGSKDRTAKIWSLECNKEILTLRNNPHGVTNVTYCEDTKLIYSVSTYLVNVYDSRISGERAIKSLLSSGLIPESDIEIAQSSHLVSCPAGETTINAIVVNSTGSMLLTAAGNSIRLWDAREWKPVGKLVGNHQAAVMVMALDDTDTADGSTCVVSGSKDHYIKVFELDQDTVGAVQAKATLNPPHYDGIQSLCVIGDMLLSGSRDMCIKIWDLSNKELVHSINNAHKEWINGVDILPTANCIVSACRSGVIKLWDIENYKCLGETVGHKTTLNALAVNSRSIIFTASNDRTIKLWKVRDDLI